MLEVSVALPRRIWIKPAPSARSAAELALFVLGRLLRLAFTFLTDFSNLNDSTGLLE